MTKLNGKLEHLHLGHVALVVMGLGAGACSGSTSGSSEESVGGMAATPSTGGSAADRGTFGGAGGTDSASADGGSAADGGASAVDTGGSGMTGGAPAGGGTASVVWAETDSTAYDFESTATARLHNDGADPVYVPGCQYGYLEQSSGGAWQWIRVLPSGCSSDPEPNARQLAPGGTLGDSFSFNSYAEHFGHGTGRVRYSVGYGCQPGVPISQAQCTRLEDVYTSEFTVGDCVCPNGLCPTRDVLCTFSCPPLTIGAAVGAVAGYAYVGCGLRVMTRRIGSVSFPDVYAYDAVSGELVAAIVTAGHDTPWGPCWIVEYRFGDTHLLDQFGGLNCADAVGCQVTGDPMVPSNWICPDAGAGGSAGTGGAGGSAG